MVLKLLVFMVAVAVLEGVAGLQEKQFANGTQIKANPDHKKRSRLDKLPCIMMEGTCQNEDIPCDGVVRQGAAWCLHHRSMQCCYPKDCVLNGAVCPNGTVAVQSCIELICKNGCWVNQGRSPHCCPCHTYGATDIAPYEINTFRMNGRRGVYKFSWYEGDVILPAFGIDISLKRDGTCISVASYTEMGVTVVIWFNPSFPGSHTVTVTDQSSSGVPFSAGPSSKAHQLPIFVPPVYISCDKSSIYIIGNSGISMHVTWDPFNPKCAKNVYAYADKSVFGNLNGLCANITEDCHPRDVNATQAFIDSSKERSLRRTHLRNNQAIIESSMSEIENSCEELNYGPCIIPASEECEKMKEDCVSRMKNAIKPGQESFSDSAE